MTEIYPSDSLSAPMSKHLIIDGYNLLGVVGRIVRGGGQDGEAEREALLQDLIRYRVRLGYPITIVFDAWRQIGGTQRYDHRAGVTVIFSQHGEQADQVIQKMVRENGRDCVVVSSDHEVMDTARAHGAMVMRSQEFWPKLKRQPSLPNSRAPVKTGDDEETDLRRRPDKKGNPRKLPKAKRNRLRNLKKF